MKPKSSISKPISNPKLKPCPFCGGKAALDVYDELPNKNWAVVVCKKCGATFQDVQTSKKEAIVAWNKRAKK